MSARGAQAGPGETSTRLLLEVCDRALLRLLDKIDQDGVFALHAVNSRISQVASSWPADLRNELGEGSRGRGKRNLHPQVKIYLCKCACAAFEYI